MRKRSWLWCRWRHETGAKAAASGWSMAQKEHFQSGKGGKASEEIGWSIRVPLLKNRMILTQLGLALGIPLGLLFLVLLLARAWNGLAMVGGALALGFLLVLLVFRGTYDVQFQLDDRGITCQTQRAQKKRVRRMAAATVLIGTLKGNPTTAAAGMMAGARTEQRLLWRQIRKAKYLDQQRTILLRAGFAETAAVFCTEENYAAVRRMIEDRVRRDAGGKRAG